MSGTIDLGDVTQSNLQLSEPVRGLGRSLLRPVDISRLKVNAGLVYLSATQAPGIPVSDASYQVGVVSAFLMAGADAVIARFQTTQNESTEKLLTDFYKQLESTGNVTTALTESKRKFLHTQKSVGLHDWAAFQAFID